MTEPINNKAEERARSCLLCHRNIHLQLYTEFYLIRMRKRERLHAFLLSNIKHTELLVNVHNFVIALRNEIKESKDKVFPFFN